MTAPHRTRRNLDLNFERIETQHRVALADNVGALVKLGVAVLLGAGVLGCAISWVLSNSF